jgi:hypothetical protein
LQYRKYELSLQDEAKKAEQKQKIASRNFIRYHSDRKTGLQITFSSTEAIPAILTPQFNTPPTPPKSVSAELVVTDYFLSIIFLLVLVLLLLFVWVNFHREFVW